MSELNEYQKMLRILKSPYKKSNAYEKYGDLTQDDNDDSTFWKSSIGFVTKYECVKIPVAKK